MSRLQRSVEYTHGLECVHWEIDRVLLTWSEDVEMGLTYLAVEDKDNGNIAVFSSEIAADVLSIMEDFSLGSLDFRVTRILERGREKWLGRFVDVWKDDSFSVFLWEYDGRRELILEEEELMDSSIGINVVEVSEILPVVRFFAETGKALP